MTLIGASAVLAPGGVRAAVSSAPSATSNTSGDLYFASLQEVARRIQSRDLSPIELTRLMLERITRVDPRLKSFATVMSDQALADANAAFREIQAGRYRGPLHGVPIAVKDLCYTKGVRTMAGTARKR